MVKNVFIMTMLLFYCILTFCSIEHLPFDRAGLTYKGKLIYNNEFRIDGLYYHYMYENGIRYEGSVWISYFFQDGTYFQFNVALSEFLNLADGDFIDIPDKLRKIPTYWGAYIIDGNLIKVQTYDPSWTTSKFRVEEHWATIENDTTIHFFKRILPPHKSQKEVKMDEMLHFRSTISKPDSTNVLMK